MRPNAVSTLRAGDPRRQRGRRLLCVRLRCWLATAVVQPLPFNSSTCRRSTTGTPSMLPCGADRAQNSAGTWPQVRGIEHVPPTPARARASDAGLPPNYVSPHVAGSLRNEGIAYARALIGRGSGGTPPLPRHDPWFDGDRAEVSISHRGKAEGHSVLARALGVEFCGLGQQLRSSIQTLPPPRSRTAHPAMTTCSSA